MWLSENRITARDNMCILTVIQQAISANTSNTQHLYEYTQTLCKYTRLKPKKVNVFLPDPRQKCWCCWYLKERCGCVPFFAFSAWLPLLLAWHSREIKQHKTTDVMEGEFRLPVHSEPKINTAQLRWGWAVFTERRFTWNRLGLLW